MTIFKSQNNQSRRGLLALFMVIALGLALSATTPAFATEISPTRVHHKTVNIDGLDIFYREAGSKDMPTLLLLHGFPTSSQMFRNLIPALADRYHVVAPDYPGFGNSSMPSVTEFDSASITWQRSLIDSPRNWSFGITACTSWTMAHR